MLNLTCGAGSLEAYKQALYQVRLGSPVAHGSAAMLLDVAARFLPRYTPNKSYHREFVSVASLWCDWASMGVDGSVCRAASRNYRPATIMALLSEAGPAS